MKILATAVTAAAALAASAQLILNEDVPLNEKKRGHENIEWQIAYGFHMNDKVGEKLPRVLLVGDSITAQYAGEVAKALDGKAVVSYWASSYCVTSPNFLKMLDVQLSEAKIDVVHFNNGLHSLQTPVAAYAKGLEDALAFVRKRLPAAKLVWVPSTPMEKPGQNALVVERNAAAAEVAKKLGITLVDDLYASMFALDHSALWADGIHFRAEIKPLQAKQIAASVMKALGK